MQTKGASQVGERGTLLVVDDSADDLLIFVRAVRAMGLASSVHTATDGEIALRLLGIGDSPSQASIRPELIVCDLKMPKVAGDAVLERTRASEEHGAVRFVIFSSSSEPRDVQRCMELGADEYVQKPIDYAEYVDRVRSTVSKWLRPA